MMSLVALNLPVTRLTPATTVCYGRKGRHPLELLCFDTVPVEGANNASKSMGLAAFVLGVLVQGLPIVLVNHFLAVCFHGRVDSFLEPFGLGFLVLAVLSVVGGAERWSPALISPLLVWFQRAALGQVPLGLIDVLLVEVAIGLVGHGELTTISVG